MKVFREKVFSYNRFSLKLPSESVARVFANTKGYVTCKFSTRNEFNSTYGQSFLRGYMLKQVEISALWLFQPCLKGRVEISTRV